MTELEVLVDESGFEFQDPAPAAVDSSLARWCDLVDSISDWDAQLQKWSQVWHVSATPTEELHELLFRSSLVDRDLRVLTGRILDRIPDWDDAEKAGPCCVGVICAGDALDLAPSVALALDVGVNKGSMCVTTDQSGRSGQVRVAHDPCGRSGGVWFIGSRSDGETFWRDILAHSAGGAEELGKLAQLAFPRLEFAHDVWTQVSRFEGRTADVMPQVVAVLSGLADHAVLIWANEVEPRVIMARMASEANVECSPESPKTHRNRGAMALRDAQFGSQTVRCEWHAKLEPHRNRIHFKVDAAGVKIGIFAAHLPV